MLPVSPTQVSVQNYPLVNQDVLRRLKNKVALFVLGLMISSSFLVSNAAELSFEERRSRYINDCIEDLPNWLRFLDRGICILIYHFGPRY